MGWWHYLLLVNFYLVLFFGFYALLLRNETFFQLNRIYLIGAALLSFFIPLIQASWVKNLFITQQVQHTLYSTYNAPIMVYGYTFKPVDKLFTLGQAFSYLYVLIALLLIIKLLWQLVVLKNEIRKPDPSIAYSFFKKISVGNNLSNPGIINEHEQVHARQWHTIDVLIIEIVAIINWFNPIVYLYRFAIKYVHEFIADRQVTEAGTDKADYALLLLSQTFDIPNHYLASNFYNHSLLKQRIIMLQKNRSNRIALAKYGLSVPLFVLMLILSSATINNSHTIKTISAKAEELLLSPISASAAMLTSPEVLPPPEVKPDRPQLHRTSSDFDRDLAEAEAASEAVDQLPETIDTANKKKFQIVEVVPRFPGGADKFSQFLAANLRYPSTDKDHNTPGNVTLQFVVEADGSLSHIQATRSPSVAMSEEAIRVLNSSPKWLPVIQNGHPVRAMYTIPISFKLNSNEPANTGNPLNLLNNGMVDINKALIIIDGVEAVNIKSVKPENIAGVQILKPQIAMEKYGTKGVNGVVLITTSDNEKTALLQAKTN
ncbi:MAG: energy transducer TonB [Mucilaginibacter sp.]